nr:MAG TPA: hypothetical protein [Caudoviricetes sp.]
MHKQKTFSTFALSKTKNNNRRAVARHKNKKQ